MEFQVYQVQLSRADYAVGLSAVMTELARLDTARGRVLFGRLAVAIATMIIVVYAFPYSLPGLMTAALLIWVGDWLVQAAFRTQTVGVSFVPAAHANTRVEFSEGGIAEQGELRTRRWTWDAVVRLHSSSDHVVIELKGWDMIVLPNRLWATPEERKAFMAELESRRLSRDTRTATPSAAEAEARVMLIEPVLLVRVSLAVVAFHLIFETQLPFDGDGGRGAAFGALGVALLGGAMVWWASGKAFQWLTARSPSAALRTAWTLLLLLGAAFASWFFRLI